ncbi:hypothetical protein AAFF_G00370480 [Aldrovandia affinis]|uniref:Galectin n=1 Tax=Aldrovandia affinis TaxID=143900 RepID=A0AAD7SH00_9TELE|nr:hypothetical protein AAFF_G00370480 [Aldrovandia affinis]
MAFIAPPGYQPVYNPSVPYVGPIYGGLRERVSVYIQGVIPQDITRFQVNLQCGEAEGCDIAMHFNPRFDDMDKVVFNSFQSGSWESEDNVQDMPFSKGQAFELVIAVTAEGYQVNVNGRQFHHFAHRVPLDRVSALQISGDVSIQTINIIGGGQRGPQGYPGGMGVRGGWGGMGYPGSNLPMIGGTPNYNPPVPYCEVIPGGLSPKRTIIIRGMLPHGATRFVLNFKVGGTEDIAFHMNPRVLEGQVVRNSCLGGTWGQEERELSHNPFLEGQYFDISVRCGNQRFKVFVNGQHLCDFSHRFQPFSQINTLEILGDVQLSYVHF